jgi:hypothetical protein
MPFGTAGVGDSGFGISSSSSSGRRGNKYVDDELKNKAQNIYNAFADDPNDDNLARVLKINKEFSYNKKTIIKNLLISSGIIDANDGVLMENIIDYNSYTYYGNTNYLFADVLTNVYNLIIYALLRQYKQNKENKEQKQNITMHNLVENIEKVFKLLEPSKNAQDPNKREYSKAVEYYFSLLASVRKKNLRLFSPDVFISIFNIDNMFNDSSLQKVINKQNNGLSKVFNIMHNNQTLTDEQKLQYLANVNAVMELLIKQYKGKYSVISIGFRNTDKLERRINTYCEMVLANIKSIEEGNPYIPLPDPSVIVSNIINNEKSIGIKGGIRTRKNKRKTSKKTTANRKKTTANRKKRNSYRKIK